MMKHRRIFDTTFTILFLLLMTTGIALAQDKAQTDDCKASSVSQSEEKIFFGESRKLGNGSIRSWVKLDGACNPRAIGVTFTEAALTGLPAEPPQGGFGFGHTLTL